MMTLRHSNGPACVMFGSPSLRLCLVKQTKNGSFVGTSSFYFLYPMTITTEVALLSGTGGPAGKREQ